MSNSAVEVGNEMIWLVNYPFGLLSHGRSFSGRIRQGQSPQLHGLRLDPKPRLRRCNPSFMFVQFSKILIAKDRTQSSASAVGKSSHVKGASERLKASWSDQFPILIIRYDWILCNIYRTLYYKYKQTHKEYPQHLMWWASAAAWRSFSP